jgi:hypothetical protein
VFVVDKVVRTSLATGIIEQFLQLSGLVGSLIKAVENIITDVP